MHFSSLLFSTLLMVRGSVSRPSIESFPPSKPTGADLNVIVLPKENEGPARYYCPFKNQPRCSVDQFPEVAPDHVVCRYGSEFFKTVTGLYLDASKYVPVGPPPSPDAEKYPDSRESIKKLPQCDAPNSGMLVGADYYARNLVPRIETDEDHVLGRPGQCLRATKFSGLTTMQTFAVSVRDGWTKGYEERIKTTLCEAYDNEDCTKPLGYDFRKDQPQHGLQFRPKDVGKISAFRCY